MNTLDNFDPKELAKLPKKIRDRFDLELDSDGWPEKLALPRAKDLRRGDWVQPECGTTGCLVGWIGWAFHRDPTIHLGAEEDWIVVRPNGQISHFGEGTVVCRWSDRAGLGEAASQFLRELLVELGADLLHESGLTNWETASDLYESGAIDERQIAKAWRAVAARHGYDV